MRRGTAHAMAILALVAALAVMLTACGGDDDPPPEVAVATAEPTPTATATATPRPTRTPTATPEPTETATEAVEGIASVTSLSTFVADYGYPSDATFARLRIPVLGVDAQVASRYVGGDALMPNPSGPAEVVWYDLSAWNNMGGAPGGGGNAIFSGHVDYNATVRYADVHYRGKGVFGELQRLGNGDVIEVDYNGSTIRYAVTWVRQLHATADDWAPIWRQSGTDSVTLYTCGGDFDPASRSYSDRIVVRAERI
ncbi:MAG: class F sortase [Chloroflexi bacterium]|nr:class F sortase [Chloroflexota bacterium]